jgi:hypothetical protein
MRNDDSIFVPYDDNDINHVQAGPDYGQPSSSSAWSEIDSVEYPEFVSMIEEKILKTRPLKVIKFP